jgi:methionyl-tRNA synthetase
MSKSFYLTTAIDYANGAPHLGHAYEKILADVIARCHRALGEPVHFLTGLDEHGQKVQQSARAKGMEPQDFVDSNALLFLDLCRRLNISNNDFIRTTEPRHKNVVQDILQKLYDDGKIYKADYRGWYSTRQEQFLQEKDRVDGEWPEIFGEVVEIIEPNYFFKLSEYQDWWRDHLQATPDWIFPEYRRKQVLEFLREPLNDLCISRPKERLEWGIELPFDKDFVTYVWFDALVNYYSAVADRGEDSPCWPADLHIIGKDILLPPHSVYWPIMLHAMNIPLPKKLLVHGWWLRSGAKMAKSTGNIVNPLDLADHFGVDAFRYFVIREMNVGQDSDFSEILFLSRYEGDLANDLGNLVSRVVNMTQRYCDSKIPSVQVEEQPEQELLALGKGLSDACLKDFERFQFHTALDRIWGLIRGLNRYAEARAPWKLAKSSEAADQAALQTTLANLAEGIRLASVLLHPVMPETSEKILSLLGEPPVTLWQGRLDWGNGLSGNSIGDKVILFPKKELPGFNAE